MPIIYAREPDLSAEAFRDILIASTLGERRPVHDLERLRRMLRAADLIVTARDEGRLVGISRALTDFSYCCYLSDLAVDAAYYHLAPPPPGYYWVRVDHNAVLAAIATGVVLDVVAHEFH